MSLRIILSRVRWTVAGACRVHQRPDPLDELAPRYLEGDLSAEWTLILDEQLDHDPVLRRQFASILLNERQLRQIGCERWGGAGSNFEVWLDVQG